MGSRLRVWDALLDRSSGSGDADHEEPADSDPGRSPRRRCRDSLGDYIAAFMTAGILGALIASRINHEPLSPVPVGSRP